MQELLGRHAFDHIFRPTKVLDVGSYDAGLGTYRPLLECYDTITYHGLDISEGAGVDIVSEDPYNWPLQDNSYDLVISGQCLEHVEAPWLWIKEVYRVCKPGGLVFIIAPWTCGEHRYPVDCWRILPDGMKYLVTKTAGFQLIECGRNDINAQTDIGDCWAVGRK
jgi:ubiquinone/menaquinone biosynthesis C-methylase UbiE